MHEDEASNDGVRRTCGGGAAAPGDGSVPATTPGERRPVPLDVRCLACDGSDLDVGVQPRGDEPVQCRKCGEWNTYLRLEIAAVERVRRERLRRR